MGSVKEIEEAVLRLSAAELAAFRAWFAEFDAEAWDRQIDDCSTYSADNGQCAPSHSKNWRCFRAAPVTRRMFGCLAAYVGNKIALPHRHFRKCMHFSVPYSGDLGLTIGLCRLCLLYTSPSPRDS